MTGPKASLRSFLRGKHGLMREVLGSRLAGGGPAAVILTRLLGRATRLARLRTLIYVALALSLLGGALLSLLLLVAGEGAAAAGETLLAALQFAVAPVALVGAPALFLINRALAKLEAEIFLRAAELPARPT